MASRLLSFAVWAVVLASALFWGLKVFVPRPALPAQAQAPSRASVAGGELTRLLGASVVAAANEDEEEPAAESERFRLLGVVAPRGAGHSPQGVALIAVDNQPARSWRTGATIIDDVVLLAVDKRSVKLGPRGGPATTELSLPGADQVQTGPVAGAGLPPGVRLPGQMGTNGQAGVLQGGAQAVARPGMVQQPGAVNGQAVRQPTQAQQNQTDDDEEEDE